MHERFFWKKHSLIRDLAVGDFRSRSEIEAENGPRSDGAIWDQAILRGSRPALLNSSAKARIRIVDLFSGAGGLSWGVCEGLRSLGLQPDVELAADLDGDALRIYERNLSPREALRGDVSDLVRYEILDIHGRARFARKPWITDRRLASRLAGVDVLIGGPPCQGHSNLNNHTRRFDARNELYLAMPAVAAALDVPVVIIENVREVRADRYRVVERTIELLRSCGYRIAEGVFSAVHLGLPQTRNRYFLVAVKGPSDEGVDELRNIYTLSREATDLRWVMGDLDSMPLSGLHRPACLSAENLRRIDWLTTNDKLNLADSQRPDCHRNGTTYRSVYGRLHWEGPAGTITTGFLTPGRGRFIHPSQRRALTPHEAARIQGFPDRFDFRNPDGSFPANKTLAKVIGDAVPPIMGQAAIFSALELAKIAREALETAAA